MWRTDRFAYLLIGLGVLALLARLSDGAGWLWLGLVAAALLVGYVQQRTFGFLVLGSVLAGTTVGLLLQQVVPRCDGVFLISLGAGLVAIEFVDARGPRWARWVGAALVLIGTVNGLLGSGLLSSTWFALLLIAAGALLLWQRREAAAFPPQVRGGPGPHATAGRVPEPPAEVGLRAEASADAGASDADPADGDGAAPPRQSD